MPPAAAAGSAEAPPAAAAGTAEAPPPAAAAAAAGMQVSAVAAAQPCRSQPAALPGQAAPPRSSAVLQVLQEKVPRWSTRELLRQ